MIVFHKIGRWDRPQLRLRWTESSLRETPEVRAIIETEWRDALLRQPPVHLFDGPMCRLERVQSEGAVLEMELSRTSYKTFYGTNLTHPELAEIYGEEVMARAVGVSVGLVSADGYFMLGRRNSSVAYYPNRLHPFAGTLEPDDALDAFAAAERELMEELDLLPAEICAPECIGLVEDQKLSQPELILCASTTKTRQQIESKIDQAEHHDAWAVRAEAQAVERELHEESLFTPVARATILLFGRIRFGGEWFEAAARTMRR
jgi:hypothetical protein